jgi:predicted lipoprotein with Yx(FWY)xxD motif
MKAIAVTPGKRNSIHLEKIPEPVAAPLPSRTSCSPMITVTVRRGSRELQARVTPMPDLRLRKVFTRLVIAILALAALGGATAQSDLAAASRPSVTVESSSYGRILFDKRGFVLYGFTRDARGRSRCSGACAKAWPPYIVKSRPRPGKGVVGGRLRVIRRAGGQLQVTYFGRPLYYYVGDRKPGQILCQNVTEFGGVWRVVRPTGRLVGG